MEDSIDTVFVSGLWFIDNNKKNSVNHYWKYLPRSLNILQGREIYFYTDNEYIKNQVYELCRENNITLNLRHKRVEDLDKFNYRDRFLKSVEKYGLEIADRPLDFNREKGLAHYWRDYLDSGIDCYKSVLTIWHSKIDLLCECYAEDQRKCYSWVDASISRFESQIANLNSVILNNAGATPCLYDSLMKKNGELLECSAHYIYTPSDQLMLLKNLYDARFELMVDEAFPNDEEIVLSSIFKSNPNLINIIRRA